MNPWGRAALILETKLRYDFDTDEVTDLSPLSQLEREEEFRQVLADLWDRSASDIRSALTSFEKELMSGASVKIGDLNWTIAYEIEEFAAKLHYLLDDPRPGEERRLGDWWTRQRDRQGDLYWKPLHLWTKKEDTRDDEFGRE